MKQAHGFSVAVLLAAAGMAGGCASSQMNRIDRNRDIYETWPLEVRQAVLDGKVEPGMTPDMVVVAWGKPSEVVTQSANGDEIWVYKKGGSPGDVYYPGGAQYPASMGGMGGIYGGGPGIGISTGRGGTVVGATGGVGVGMGGGMGGPVIGPVGGMGGMGTAIVTPPTPPEIREVVFRNGVVLKADKP